MKWSRIRKYRERISNVKRKVMDYEKSVQWFLNFILQVGGHVIGEPLFRGRDYFTLKYYF